MASMGRIILLLLIIAAVVLVVMAFGPQTWRRKVDQADSPAPRAIKGPDDDEDFLWELEKRRFKERRAQERAAEEKRRAHPDDDEDPGHTPDGER